MRKFLYSIALLAAVGIGSAASAAVPAGVDDLVTTTKTTMFTFVTDVITNYASLVLWVLFLGFILGLILTFGRKFIGGGVGAKK